MPIFPEDIFTEPANVDPDTLANLDPLRRRAGGWEARQGVDLNPQAEGPERRVYIAAKRGTASGRRTTLDGAATRDAVVNK